MKFEYNTLKTSVSEVLIKEKGSKFIGFAFPLGGEADLKKNLDKIRAEHPKATHHCYAFRLGINGENYRANDDGEPSGSAGLPIYNQLLAHEITNVLVIIVRYYGGTKLGVAGLVKAYKECAKQTIESAEIVTKELETTVVIHFSFEKQNQIFTLLNKFDARIEEFMSEENCSISARIKTSIKENISEQMFEMQNISFEFLDQ
ncbi:hypothetical conserved protein [Flavobacteriaceae bacterium 3519-10]|nr:hypothetical conserved protein [Flavobacteriaceae bacterium 3519-10]